MSKQDHVHVDELLVITPLKGASIETIKSMLEKSKLVQSIAEASVAHIDNIAKQAVTLFDQALLHLLSGKVYDMKKENAVVSLTEDFSLADKALDSAIRDSKESRDMIKEMSRTLADANQLGQSALKESMKII